MIFGCGRVIPALPFLEVFFLGRRDTWDWLFALVIQVYAVAAKHDERARETCILSAQPGSDLRVRIHAHHIGRAHPVQMLLSASTLMTNTLRRRAFAWARVMSPASSMSWMMPSSMP